GTLTSRGVEVFFNTRLNSYFSLSGNLNLVNGKLSYNPSVIDSTHTRGNHIQLFNNGIFPAAKVESIGLTRRPVTANLFFTWQPLKGLSIQISSRWIGQHTDVFYDSNLGPFGALNTITLEDYVLFDVLLSYQFNKYISAMLKAENLFNTSFTDLRGFTSRGRGIFLSLYASM
ncbi:MAG: TonB-dependent receptor, partial [Chitinophagales bacterium]